MVEIEKELEVGTETLVWRWMREYQGLYGQPPTLREIRDAMQTLNYPSSVRHSLRLLMEQGRVAEIKPVNLSRRYLALGKAR